MGNKFFFKGRRLFFVRLFFFYFYFLVLVLGYWLCICLMHTFMVVCQIELGSGDEYLVNCQFDLICCSGTFVCTLYSLHCRLFSHASILFYSLFNKHNEIMYSLLFCFNRKSLTQTHTHAVSSNGCFSIGREKHLFIQFYENVFATLMNKKVG